MTATCRHCGEPATRPRQLCYAHYEDRAVRRLYPRMTPAESGLHARLVHGGKRQTKTTNFYASEQHYDTLAALVEAELPLRSGLVEGRWDRRTA